MQLFSYPNVKNFKLITLLISVILVGSLLSVHGGAKTYHPMLTRGGVMLLIKMIYVGVIQI